MNVRSALPRTARRAIWLTAITGALAIAPMIMSAATAHADSVDWDAIAQCESGGNWSTNTGNGLYGGLQFKPATWASNGGVGHPAMASREEQIRVAENVLQTQGLRAWPKCGSNAGGPAMWTAQGPQEGCQAVRGGSVLGFVDLRQLCSTFLRPFGLG
jgi:resuscitation-promoting factor RpfC